MQNNCSRPNLNILSTSCEYIYCQPEYTQLNKIREVLKYFLWSLFLSATNPVSEFQMLMTIISLWLVVDSIFHMTGSQRGQGVTIELILLSEIYCTFPYIVHVLRKKHK